MKGVKLHGGDKADLTVNMKCTQNDRIHIGTQISDICVSVSTSH